jgi:hypothetical protein
LGEDRNIFKCCCVEQADESEATETENRSVGGSIPPLGTIPDLPRDACHPIIRRHLRHAKAT